MGEEMEFWLCYNDAGTALGCDVEEIIDALGELILGYLMT